MKKTTYIIMALAAVIFTAAGCAKQEVGTEGSDYLMSIEPEVEATKALINDAAGLRTQGFGLSIYNGTTAYKDKEAMVYKNGAWAPKDGTMDWRWALKTVYTFYAWSPAELNVGTVTSAGVPPFTYEGIASQTDIMLGYYSGIGNSGAAPIKFSHALASIQFKTGTIKGLGNIKSIGLSGVVTSGTCTPTMSGSETVNFAWSGLGTSTTEVSQSGLTVTSTASGTAIGTPFLTLPQTDKPLTVTLTDNNDKTIAATIPAPALTVGKTSVYTIDYDAGKGLTFGTPTVIDWGVGEPHSVDLDESKTEV